jgi:hypothetical protein
VTNTVRSRNIQHGDTPGDQTSAMPSVCEFRLNIRAQVSHDSTGRTLFATWSPCATDQDVVRSGCADKHVIRQAEFSDLAKGAFGRVRSHIDEPPSSGRESCGSNDGGMQERERTVDRWASGSSVFITVADHRQQILRILRRVLGTSRRSTSTEQHRDRGRSLMEFRSMSVDYQLKPISKLAIIVVRFI